MASVSYEVNKFNPQPSAELLCAICFNVLHEARMCPCHHIFCDCCIRKWLENNHTCPTCRRRVNLQQLESAPPLVQNVLNSLTMDCDFKDEGCDQSILKENFPSHIGNCDFRPVSCPHKDCTNKTTARALADHTEECRYRSLQCPKRCKLPFPAHELERHDCFTALQDRVQELDSILHRHQLVLKWIRMKMNTMQVSNDPVALQLQAYRDLFKDINQYWPENQAFPLLLCGSYVAPAVPLRQLGSGLPASASSANEVDNSALEQLAAEADVQNMPGVFGPRDPDGAEGPTAHDGQDTPTRGVVYEEDIEDGGLHQNAYFSPEEIETWDSSTNLSYADYYNNPQSDGGDSPYHENSLAVHRYQSHDNSVTRSSRQHGGNTPRQNRDYLLVTHSPGRSHSDFEEDNSYHTLSSGHFSTYSDQDNYTSASQSSAAYSHQPQSSSVVGYNRYHHDSDSADPNWNYSSSRTDFESHCAESHYHSRSRSPSLSPRDENNDRDRHPRSYSPREQYSPLSDSYSARSPTRSSENSEGSYSASLNPDHSRSRSRSCSSGRGRSFSRSPDHRQNLSRSHSSNTSLSFSSSNRGHPADTSEWVRSDEDRNNGSAENHSEGTRSWVNDNRSSNIEQWSSSERGLGQGLAENESFTKALDGYERLTPVPSPSHTDEHETQADSTNTYSPSDEVVTHDQVHFLDNVEEAHSERHSVLSPSEQGNSHWISPVDLYRDQERSLNSGVSETASHEQGGQEITSPDFSVGHQAHLEEQAASHSNPSKTHFQQASSSQDNIRTFENTASGSRTAEEGHGNDSVDIRKQEALQRAIPSCSYAQSNEKGTVENSKLGCGKTANDGSQKSVHPDTSQNVWESSSNTTSLDYDIAEELTPKPISPHDSGSDCNSPETEGKHTTDGISGKADQAQTPDIEGTHRKIIGKYRINCGDNNSRNQSENSDSEEDIPYHQTKEQARKKHSGKGKALKKSKRKNRMPSVDSDTDEDSNSTVCFKRKMKVKKLSDSASNSEVSVKETETQINQNDRDGVDEAIRQSSLPSTSQVTLDTVDVKRDKGKRKKKKKSDKKKLKLPSSKTKVKSEQKTKEKKRKRHKSDCHSPVKKARHDSSVSHRESGTAVSHTSKSAHQERPNTAINIWTPGSNIQEHSHMSTGHGSENTMWTEWSAGNPRRTLRSHTYSRHELTERADHEVESSGVSSCVPNSRGRKHSQRPMDTEGRRGNERRVIESHSARTGEGSGPHNIAACRPEREASAQTQTSGQRIMSVDGSYAPSIPPREASQAQMGQRITRFDSSYVPSIPPREASQAQTGQRIMRLDGSQAPSIPPRDTYQAQTTRRRIMRLDGSQAPSIVAYHPEREAAQTHTGERRITRVDNLPGQMETRRRAAEENTRKVLVADVPVPTRTLDLLNQYDNSDETDSTWSLSSTWTESSSTV